MCAWSLYHICSSAGVDRQNQKSPIVNHEFGGFVMATEAQVLANRANAGKSTGPRTPEGKAVVSQNAVKHGLLARAAALQGEDPEEFAEYREQLLEELGAEGALEATVAERIVGLSWRLQRAARSQNAAFETLYDKQAARAPKGSVGLGPGIAADNGPILGQMLVTDFANTRVLKRLLVYERRIEGSLLRMTAEGITCETKPIVPGSHASQVSYGAEVMSDSVPDGLGENKANSPEQRAGEAVARWAGGPTPLGLRRSDTG
jgi:hypothetical protein